MSSSDAQVRPINKIASNQRISTLQDLGMHPPEGGAGSFTDIPADYSVPYPGKHKDFQFSAPPLAKTAWRCGFD